MRRVLSAVAALILITGCAPTDAGELPTAAATGTPLTTPGSPPGLESTGAATIGEAGLPDPRGDSRTTRLLFDDVHHVWYGNPALDRERYAPGSGVPADDSLLAGSKCAPGGGDSLPDGIWAVRVAEWGDDLTVDLVCWYLANYVATWDMMIAQHPECDTAQIYQASAECHGFAERVITNDNPALRTQPVDPAAEYVGPGDNAVGLRWAIENDPLFDPTQTFWIYVNAGLVTQVYQPFEAGN